MPYITFCFSRIKDQPVFQNLGIFLLRQPSYLVPIVRISIQRYHSQDMNNWKTTRHYSLLFLPDLIPFVYVYR